MYIVSLIGTGHFGLEYYKELKGLEAEGKLDIGFIANLSGNSATNSISHKLYSIESIPDDEIEKTDLFIILSPPKKHAEHALRFAQRGHLLIEKPFVVDSTGKKLAQQALIQTQYLIEVAQIFQFHPLAAAIHSILANRGNTIYGIDAEFINNDILCIEHSYTLELNHMLEIVLSLLRGKTILNVARNVFREHEKLCILFQEDILVTSTCGWRHDPFRKRSISLHCRDGVSYVADFMANTLVKNTRKACMSKTFYPPSESLIRLQILDILSKIRSIGPIRMPKPSTRVDQALELYDLLLHPSSKSRSAASNKPRAAVIGGGIFGSCCAIELAKDFDVDLYEEKPDLLQVASLNNQWRHHHGFHYPLSFETLAEICSTRKLFEDKFKSCIVSNVSSYYFVSSWASEIPAKRYLASCNLFGLEYEICTPPVGVDPTAVAISLLTPEKIYDIRALRMILHRQLKDSSVTLFLNSRVQSVELTDQGLKKITVADKDKILSKKYDFVANCTNGLGNFTVTGLPSFDSSVRRELVELVEVDVEYPMNCLTVIDGPFVSITTMGSVNRFLVSHKDHSLHSKVSNSANQVLATPASFQSNAANIMRSAIVYFPFLRHAQIIKSHFGFKGISPYSKEVWERPTEVRDHGFGMATVIGGKILVAPTIAQDVCKLAKSYHT